MSTNTGAETDPREKTAPGVGDTWRVSYPEPLGALVPDGANDQLLHISVGLAAELWTVRRRLAELERQLVEAGSVTSPDGIRHEPDDVISTPERDAFIARVFGSLSTPAEG